MSERGTGFKKIHDLREKIDAIDDQLLWLVSRRVRLAIEVGLVKKHSGLAARSSVRERQILRRLVGANPGPLPHSAVRRIFHQVVQESRRAAIRVRYGRG